MENGFIHPNTLKEIFNYATSQGYRIIVDGREYEWDGWYDGWKLESGMLRLKDKPEDVTNYIHFESIRDIRKGEDMRSVTFKEGDSIRVMIFVEHVHLTPLLNHVLSCF